MAPAGLGRNGLGWRRAARKTPHRGVGTDVNPPYPEEASSVRQSVPTPRRWASWHRARLDPWHGMCLRGRLDETPQRSMQCTTVLERKDDIRARLLGRNTGYVKSASLQK